MKKLLALLLICLNIVLVGCANTDLTLDIDKKGNMTVDMKLLMTNYITTNMIEDVLQSVKKDYNIDSVEKIKENNKSGYLLIKNLGNIKDAISNKNKDMKENEFIDISKEKSLIYDTYKVTLNIKKIILGETTEKDMGIIDFIGNPTNINFHMTTPFKLLESNATNIAEIEDGRTTYTWNYTLNILDNMYIKFKVPNFVNISIMICGVLAIIISIFIIKKKKNKLK